MDYKLKINNVCGFPKISLDKVLTKLKLNKINYKVVTVGGYIHPTKLQQQCFKENNYNKYLDKFKLKLDINQKVNIVIEKIKKASLEDINNIIKIIDDELK